MQQSCPARCLRAPHPAALHRSQTLEIIVALKKLGEELTADEKAFLRDNDDAMAQFESADQGIDSTVVSSAVGGAAQG